MAKDTWFARDLPVLDAIVTYFDESLGRSFPQVSDIAEVTGFDVDDVARAARNLDGSYIDLTMTMGPPAGWHVSQISADARVATGQWPSAQSMAAQIIAGLEATADREEDEGRKWRLREAAEVLGGTVKDLSTNVLATVIAKQLGLA